MKIWKVLLITSMMVVFGFTFASACERPPKPECDEGLITDVEAIWVDGTPALTHIHTVDVPYQQSSAIPPDQCVRPGRSWLYWIYDMEEANTGEQSAFEAANPLYLDAIETQVGVQEICEPVYELSCEGVGEWYDYSPFIDDWKIWEIVSVFIQYDKDTGNDTKCHMPTASVLKNTYGMSNLEKTFFRAHKRDWIDAQKVEVDLECHDEPVFEYTCPVVHWSYEIVDTPATEGYWIDPVCSVPPLMCEWDDQLLADDPLCVEPIYGCTIEGSDNYNEFATVDDGSCFIAGCMDEDALNYNSAAIVDDGLCEYEHDWDWGYSCLNEEDCCAGDMMDPQVSAGGTYVTDMPGSPPYPFPYSDDGVQQFYPADAMAGGRYTIQFFWPDGYQTDPMEFYLYEPEDCDSEEKCNSVPVIEYIIQGKQFKCTLYGSAADGDSIYKLPNDVLGWMTDGTCDLQPLECHGECIRSEVLKFERNVSGQFSGKKLNICYETTPWTGCDGELIYPPNPIDNLR